MSLRAELIAGGESLPDFAVLLPEGWVAFDDHFSGLEARVEAALGAVPLEARPAAREGVTRLLETARADAARADVIRSFAPSAADPADAAAVSLVVSWLTAPAGATLAELAADAAGRFGARPLDPDGTILTWPLEERTALGDADLTLVGHAYLLHVPGLQGKGLLFRSAIVRQADDQVVADEGIAAMVAVCDAIVASVRWRRNA